MLLYKRAWFLLCLLVPGPMAHHQTAVHENNGWIPISDTNMHVKILRKTKWFAQSLSKYGIFGLSMTKTTVWKVNVETNWLHVLS